jgi:hypothetical protein
VGCVFQQLGWRGFDVDAVALLVVLRLRLRLWLRLRLDFHFFFLQVAILLPLRHLVGAVRMPANSLLLQT